MDYQADDDTFIDAPLVPLGKGRIGEARDIIDSGLIEKTIDRMMPFISRENDTINEHFRKERKNFYPHGAIREAMLNGLAHRDWTRSLEITIINYSDRIEINSPGKVFVPQTEFRSWARRNINRFNLQFPKNQHTIA